MGSVFAEWLPLGLVHGPYMACGCWSHGCDECGAELPGCCATDLCDGCLDGHEVVEVACA